MSCSDVAPGKAEQSASLRREIDALKAQIAELQRKVSETEIGRKLRNAIDSIEATTGRLIPAWMPNGRMLRCGS